MRTAIKTKIRNLFEPIAQRMGYVKFPTDTLAPENKSSLLYTFYSNLQAIGYTPKHIVDVGANHGTWTREALKYFPDANYTLLEPQSWMEKSIKDILIENPKVKFNAVGAGDKEGSFKFTLVDRDDSCTFIITEEEAVLKGFQQVEVPVVTLNDFLPKTKLPIPDIIKIDAEGLDLQVLKGASNYFGNTEIFLIEAGVVNKSLENSLVNVVNYMDQNGYKLFEITDLNRPFKPQILWLVELAFVKNGGIIDSYEW
jgi:FkbM family methyltransferase